MFTYAQVKNGTATLIDEEGNPMSISASNPVFGKVVSAINQGDLESIPEILEEGFEEKPLVSILGELLEDFGDSRFFYDSKTRDLQFEGEEVPEPIKDYLEQNLACIEKPWRILKFTAKLLAGNISYSVRARILDFLQYCGLSDDGFEISDDGNLIAYKGVREDGTSVHQGYGVVNGEVYRNSHLPNKVGAVVTMPRHMISDDPSEGCSKGLHVGTLNYADSFSKGMVVKCEVNPADIVSVPYDCSNQKIRCCKYVVLDVFEADVKEESWGNTKFTSGQLSQIIEDFPEFEFEYVAPTIIESVKAEVRIVFCDYDFFMVMTTKGEPINEFDMDNLQDFLKAW